MTLPAQYRWLEKETGPAILKEALRWYGTLEAPGEKNNPVIIEWAKEIGGWIGQWYDKDSVPWCGLFIALCAKRAGFPFNQKALSALEWANWGTPVKTAMLGDVLVFKRTGGGHVGLYVGEDGQPDQHKLSFYITVQQPFYITILEFILMLVNNIYGHNHTDYMRNAAKEIC